MKGSDGGVGCDEGGDEKLGGDEGAGTSTGLRPQSEQSNPYSHALYSAPGPPSSHSLSNAKTHSSEQTDGVKGGAGGEAGGEGGEGGVSGGDGGGGKLGGDEGAGASTGLRPQSEHSEPYSHALYSAPGPPSSQSLSNAKTHSLEQMDGVEGCAGGDAGGEGSDGKSGGDEGAGTSPGLRPQSEQSDPYSHKLYRASGPPSSHSLSNAKAHSSEQTDGVKGGAGGEASGEGGNGGAGGGGGGEGKLGGNEGAGTSTGLRTQSEQSDPYSHTLYWAPGPPSSHSLSNA